MKTASREAALQSPTLRTVAIVGLCAALCYILKPCDPLEPSDAGVLPTRVAIVDTMTEDPDCAASESSKDSPGSPLTVTSISKPDGKAE